MKGIYAFLAGLASAFGLAWLYENNPEFRRNVDSTVEALRNRARSTGDQIRDTAQSAGERVRDVAQSGTKRRQRTSPRDADAARRAIFTGARSRSGENLPNQPQQEGSVESSHSERPDIDLNSCSREDLVHAGLTEELADKVLENRPYRNKLDLVSRLVIPEDSYELIKHSIGVDERSSDDPVKVAS